ncbi:B12-binding domain-containing protein [Rhizobium sp. RU36D]|uniref:MerR family transcriptional regulator n=1 Tax=Rhizobium sp. RU36D TaxID=1907415 RepID=UPI0009D8BD36|nr:B12-binding domain-containing protein [Rhizobium sp. RU36D]SMC96318.1 transcriptional regulator, MerR family [Rhizobium sp. RU36D]
MDTSGDSKRRSEPEDEKTLLGLADVLALAGITKLVLHAWERRYGMAPAVRSETGRRFYTAAQAERLRLLKLCTDAGHRISALVDLPDQQLVRLAEAHIATGALGPLLRAVHALDAPLLQKLLQRRADEDGPEGFVRKTVVPLMQEIGARWATGNLNVAAEHMATAVVKRILGTIMDRCPPAPVDAPCLIATTPKGEEHEIGALVAALIARLRGWNALYLGPNLPNANIIDATLLREARHVCLSALNGKPDQLHRQLMDLRAALPASTFIWSGGPGYQPVPDIPGVSFIAHLDDFIALLEAHGGQSA